MAHPPPDATSPVSERPPDATVTAAGADPTAALDAVLDLSLAAAVLAGRGVEGASVLLHAGPGAAEAAATSPDLEAVDQLQLELGDGPAFDAMASGAVQQLALRPNAPRYPNYHRAALAHGVHRVLCVPLAADGRAVGALSLFWHDVAPVAEEVQRAAEVVAARAARAIVATGGLEAVAADAPGRTEEPAPEPAEEPADDLPADQARDEVVAAARDILRSRKHYSEEEAFATLRDASARTGRPLPEVAREVVDLPEQMRPKKVERPPVTPPGPGR